MVDLIAVVLIGWILLVIAGGIRALWTHDLKVVAPSHPTREILAALLLLAYLGYGYGLTGRTLGKLLMGLRVVTDAGRDLSRHRASCAPRSASCSSQGSCGPS